MLSFTNSIPSKDTVRTFSSRPNISLRHASHHVIPPHSLIYGSYPLDSRRAHGRVQQLCSLCIAI